MPRRKYTNEQEQELTQVGINDDLPPDNYEDQYEEDFLDDPEQDDPTYYEDEDLEGLHEVNEGDEDDEDW